MQNMTGLEHYSLSPLARADLEDIWLYSATTWSRAQADVYINQLFSAFDGILSGTTQIKDMSDIREGYYRAAVGSHYIFFRRQRSEAQIIRILHQRMNTEAHF